MLNGKANGPLQWFLSLRSECPPCIHFIPTRGYGIHLRTKLIENKRQFEVQKLDYPVVKISSYEFEIAMNAVEIASFELEVTLNN